MDRHTSNDKVLGLEQYVLGRIGSASQHLKSCPAADPRNARNDRTQPQLQLGIEQCERWLASPG